MPLSRSQGDPTVVRIQNDLLLAFGKIGISLSLVYGLVAWTTFQHPTSDLVAATTLILTGSLSLAIARGLVPRRFVHCIALILLAVFIRISKYEDGAESMMFTVLPAFVLVVQVLTGTWTAIAFATGLTVWYGILMAHPGWVENHQEVVLQPFNHSRIVIVGLANAFALWFAGLPTRMLHKAYDQLARTATDLEQRVEARTLELANTNRDLAATNAGLDSFARSVSHDLRAPLRGIHGYTEQLLRLEQDRLGEESKAYLEFSLASAKRANELVDAFLELARSSTKPLEKSTCDLAEMFREGIESMRRQDPSRQVELDVPAHALAFGDPSLMRSVVENLVSNAWKYTAKTTDPRIEFRTEAGPGGTEFVVRDNGAGFDMARADRLFQHFSRLHSSEEFEGTGIGLSNVRRIVERHGGWIVGTGAKGRGAEFRFWLPAPEETSI